MNVIGIDIGSRIVKAVEIKPVKDKWELTNLGIAEISPESTEEMDPAQLNDLVVQAIKHAVQQAKVKVKNAVATVSGDNVVVRFVKMPYMTADELKGVINFESEQYIPFNLEQANIDFQILGDISEENQRKIEVLLVAAKTEIIDQRVSLLQAAGLVPARLDVDCFALSNSFELNYGQTAGEVYALIHIGARYTVINIIESGVLRFTREVPLGGSALTRDIQKSFNVSFAQAEELKLQQGSIIVESEETDMMRLPDKEDKSVKIFESIIPSLNKLLAEVRRSFDFFESQAGKKAVSKIYLSGGASRLKNFDKFLNEKLKVPVEFNNAFNAIEVKVPEITEEQIKTYSTQLGIGIGLVAVKVK